MQFECPFNINAQRRAASIGVAVCIIAAPYLQKLGPTRRDAAFMLLGAPLLR
jgi:hypothetical protein